MILIAIVFALCLKNLCVENAMMPFNYGDRNYSQNNEVEQESFYSNPTGVMSLRDLQKTTLRYDDFGDAKEFGYFVQHKNSKETLKKPCSVMVASSNQHSAMQSLLRKYRYDANGALIPSSVKYFIKMPQGYGSAPILVPLTGKAFSPLGGFVRYYKEVPLFPRHYKQLAIVTAINKPQLL